MQSNKLKRTDANKSLKDSVKLMFVFIRSGDSASKFTIFLLVY